MRWPGAEPNPTRGFSVRCSWTMTHSGSSSSPSFFATLRTRSSMERSRSPATAVRAVMTEARCIASSVRIGSPGNGCRARSTISGAIRSVCQCAAAVVKCARRSAASTSVSSPTAAARMRTRSHSIRVRSEATTISAVASVSRTFRAGSSSRSQARIALDSAYRFTGSRALHPEVDQPSACLVACAAMPCTRLRHRMHRAWQYHVSPKQAVPPARSHQLARVPVARFRQQPDRGRSRARSRRSALPEDIR